MRIAAVGNPKIERDFPAERLLRSLAEAGKEARGRHDTHDLTEQ
jgi:hypothetical protein